MKGKMSHPDKNNPKNLKNHDSPNGIFNIRALMYHKFVLTTQTANFI